MKLQWIAASAVALLIAGGPALAQAKAKAPAAAKAPVATMSPEAAGVLDRMGAYLRTLETFSVRSDATTESVFEDGQKLQFQARTTYTIARPDRMKVDMVSDTGHRQIFYNGKAMTVAGLKIRKYVTFPVTGTVGEVLARAANDYGIEFPLRDLFLWGSGSSAVEQPKSGFKVGSVDIGGVMTDHYAFRQEGVDFQIWLTQGDKPLPRKLVITSVDEPKLPQYVAYFTWDLKPEINKAMFTFDPPADFKLVDFGTAGMVAAK